MRSKIFVILSLLAFFFYTGTVFAQVVITEIMYDLPKDSGSDTGREWVEVLNTGTEDIDLADWRLFEAGVNHKLKLFQGDGVLSSGDIAIVADNPEEFLMDNINFSGTIFDSSFSLKNTGESITLRDSDMVDVDSVTYNAEVGGKGDGNSLQKINGVWTAATPTPGIKKLEVEHPGVSNAESDTSQEQTQSAQQEYISGGSWPVKPQIFAHVKNAPKIVVTGADIFIEGEALGLKKEPLDGARYLWTFGDGGVKEGQKVLYSYNYPGKYIVVLNVSSGEYSASDRFVIEAIPADLQISSVGTGINSFIEVQNKTKYELNLSWWRLRVGEQLFTIPKDTIILPNRKTIFPRERTGFVISNNENIDLLYPNGTIASSYIWTTNPSATVSIARTDVQAKQKPAKHVAPKTTASVNDRHLQTQRENREDIYPPANIGEEQTANVFTAQRTNSGIYKWIFGVAALVFVSVLGVLYMGEEGVVAEGVSMNADDYEIIEDED